MVEPINAIEAIRKWPGMYAGDVTDGTGLHALMREALNNAFAEAWAGRCDRVEIDIQSNGGAIVRDNAQGMPVGLFRGKPAVLLIMTDLLCGGWFDRSLLGKPNVLQGAGAVVSNALSERFDLRIWRDGGEYRLSFQRGAVTSPLTHVGNASRSGTEIAFLPDPDVFGAQQFELARVAAYVRSLAHLELGVTVVISDQRGGAAEPLVIRI